MKETERRILEYEDLYRQVLDKTTLATVDLLNLMRMDYEALYSVNKDYYEKCVSCCDEIINLIANHDYDRPDIGNVMASAFDTKARLGDFRAYCIALEWNRPIEKQFFLPRKKVLEKHGLIQAMQDMADDKLDFLFVSLPPRIGKSTLGLFFLTFMAGLYPDRSILGNGHSASLTQSFYEEILNLMCSEE